MTEAEWQAEHNPVMLIQYLCKRCRFRVTKVGRRKLRLFGCGCCRRAWHLFSQDAVAVLLVEAGEKSADGDKLAELARGAIGQGYGVGEYGVGQCVAGAARCVASPDILEASARASILMSNAVAYASSSGSTNDHVRVAMGQRDQQTLLLRCIVGNPFRPVTLDTSWLTSTVVALARGIYDERAFDRLPILADALMDAGCDNVDVLNHCRDAGPHARGCWVVDVLLGKA